MASKKVRPSERHGASEPRRKSRGKLLHKDKVERLDAVLVDVEAHFGMRAHKIAKSGAINPWFLMWRCSPWRKRIAAAVGLNATSAIDIIRMSVRSPVKLGTGVAVWIGICLLAAALGSDLRTRDPADPLPLGVAILTFLLLLLNPLTAGILSGTGTRKILAGLLGFQTRGVSGSTGRRNEYYTASFTTGLENMDRPAMVAKGVKLYNAGRIVLVGFVLWSSAAFVGLLLGAAMS